MESLSLGIGRSYRKQVDFVETKLHVDFLAFTRFEDSRFDYNVYFRAKDNLITELVRSIIPQDDELPYQAFFVCGDYCLLMIAELWLDSQDRIRKDNVGRNINRRTFLGWHASSQPQWLRYEHLTVLVDELRTITSQYLDVVPNDVREVLFQELSFDYSKEQLEKLRVGVASKQTYYPAIRSQLKNLQLQSVNVEVPSNFTFDEELDLLNGFRLTEQRYSIWHKPFKKIPLKFESLLNKNRWIVLAEVGKDIQFRNAKMNDVVAIINPEAPVLDHEGRNFSPTATNEFQTVGNSQRVDVSLSEPIVDLEFVDPEIITNVDFLKKEVGFFLCSTNFTFPVSIYDAWNNLLNEIRVHYTAASKNEKKEWIRRLDAIRGVLEEQIEIPTQDRLEYEKSFVSLERRIMELIDG